MANVAYADSGLGWLADRRFYKDKSGLIDTINGRSYHTLNNGPVIFATVYTSNNGYTGPVVISQDESLAAYDQGNTKSQGSFDYMGFTWYITAFRYWIVGDYPDTSGISQRLVFSTNNYEEVGPAILAAASLIREEDFTSKLTKVYYNGKNKVIKRICELINQFAKLGTTHDHAFYGDLGQIAYDHSQITSGNPHNVTAADLGLDKVNDQIASILEAIGSEGYWMDSGSGDTEYQYIVDHDGDYINFRALSNFLIWH